MNNILDLYVYYLNYIGNFFKLKVGEYVVDQLFVNGCIIISVIFIAVEFLENDRIRKLSSNKKSILSGVAFSISSIFLMKYSIYITPTAFLDFRAISQSSSAFYGGPLSSIITGLSSAVFRISYYGVDKNSILTFISMILSSLACAYISKKTLNKKIKWSLMIITSQLIHALLLVLVLGNSNAILSAIFYLFIGTVVVSTTVYYVFDHLLIAHKQVKILKEQACIDFLTGVHSSRNFNSLYEEISAKLCQEGRVFSVLMIDIDFFKDVNDTYGHLAGDEVLKDLGYILNIFARKAGIIGRVGGEEFCILLEDYNIAQATRYAEDLRACVEKTNFVIDSQKQIHITVSIGLATYKETVSDIADMREFADQKLYQSKKSGRNRISS